MKLHLERVCYIYWKIITGEPWCILVNQLDFKEKKVSYGNQVVLPHYHQITYKKIRLSLDILTLCQKQMKKHMLRYLRKRKRKPLCIIQPNITLRKKDTTVINLPNKQANSYNSPQKNREYCFSTKESFGQSKWLDNHWC